MADDSAQSNPWLITAVAIFGLWAVHKLNPGFFRSFVR